MSINSRVMNWDIFPLKREPSKSAERRKGSDYGLHTLVPNDAGDGVDIVAIHGLNGHYLQTWTDERTGTNWLTDLIPKLLPSARVMSFSYNSMLQFSKSTSDVSTFSLQLLEGIMAERQLLNESARPVIFICHSMGGLVFKQAYLLASDHASHRALKANFRGVTFFSTPHRGSAIASWAKRAAKLLELAFLGTSTNTQLAKDLEPSSKKLRYISDTFQVMCSQDKYPVVSCYETDKMSPLNTVVVDRDSAVMGIDGEIVLAVEGDHRGICRFSSLTEKRFQPVASRLRKMAGDTLTATTDLVQSLMDSLDKVDYKAHRARNPAAVEGTCRWVLDHPKFQDWLRSPEAAFLWISGDPGSGKSVLASFLVDALSDMRKTMDMNVCYFFFKSDNLEQSSAVNALQAILHQLFVQQTSLASTGVHLLRGKTLENVSHLWEGLISLRRLDATKTTICIIDAVDECAAKSRKDFLSCISSFIVAGAAAKGSGDGSTVNDSKTTALRSTIKVIVTSRPDNEIKVAFEKKPRSKELPQGSQVVKSTLIRLRAEDETDNIGEDITRVIKYKIADLVESGLPRELLKTVQHELIARADRTFLWVSLVLNLLEDKVEAGASRRELDAVLKTRDIFSIYSQLLESKSNSQRARKLLNIVLAAARALTLEEISVALAVCPANDILGQTRVRQPLKTGTLTLDDVEADIFEPFENHIKSLCGHFVRITRNKVYLVHETAREFLLVTSSEAPMQLRPPGHRPRVSGSETLKDVTSTSQTQAVVSMQETFQHSFTLIEARALLLEICVTYLYSLAKGVGNSNSGGHTAPLTKPFLPYVAKSWFVHFHQVSHRLRNEDIRYFQNLCHPLFPCFRAWIDEYCRPHPPRGPEVAPWMVDEIQDYYVDLFNIELFSTALTTTAINEGRQMTEEEDGIDDSRESEEAEQSESWVLGEKGYLDGKKGHSGESAKVAPRPILSSSQGYQHEVPLPLPPPRFVQGSSQSGFLADHGTILHIPLSSNPTSLRYHNFPLRVNSSGLVSLDYPDSSEFRGKGVSDCDRQEG